VTDCAGNVSRPRPVKPEPTSASSDSAWQMTRGCGGCPAAGRASCAGSARSRRCSRPRPRQDSRSRPWSATSRSLPASGPAANLIIRRPHPHAGWLARPALHAAPGTTRDLACSVIRVLNRAGETITLSYLARRRVLPAARAARLPFAQGHYWLAANVVHGSHPAISFGGTIARNHAAHGRRCCSIIEIGLIAAECLRTRSLHQRMLHS
jgi:hypothetical protein